METLSILQTDFAAHRAAGFQFFHATRLAPNEQVHAALLFGAFGEVRGKRIADFGCGTGSAGTWVLSRGATAYVGVNIDPLQVEATQPQNLDIRCEDMCKTSLEDNTCDIALFMESLGYVDHREALREACRVLKSGGEIWIKDFCLASESPREKLYQSWGYRFLFEPEWRDLLSGANHTVTVVPFFAEHYLPIANALGRSLMQASTLLIKVIVWKP